MLDLEHQGAPGVLASSGEVFPSKFFEESCHTDLVLFRVVSSPWVIRNKTSGVSLDGVEALYITREMRVCDSCSIFQSWAYDGEIGSFP